MLNKSLSKDTGGLRIEAGVSGQRIHGAHILLELVNTDIIYIIADLTRVLICF